MPDIEFGWYKTSQKTDVIYSKYLIDEATNTNQFGVFNSIS